MEIDTPTAADAMSELERFVVDNDDLLALEERIGRFNIFDALRIARAEIRHSNFLAWLLDPAESHGQGSLFLKAVLMDLLKQAPSGMRPLSPIELDGEELRGVEIRREWQSIDLLITCQEPPFVIAIENKVDAGEHSGQLQRYEGIVRSRFTELKPMFVFLTTDGAEASDEDWVPYSYADVHRVFDRVRQANRGAIGDDVAAFLEHYLRLIGSRFMNDTTIDDLCRRIFANHRQALELIWERAGAAGSGLPSKIADVIKEQGDRWAILAITTRSVVFAPAPWKSILPPICERKMFDPALWLVCRFEIREDHCHFAFQAWPISDGDCVEKSSNAWYRRRRNLASDCSSSRALEQAKSGRECVERMSLNGTRKADLTTACSTIYAKRLMKPGSASSGFPKFCSQFLMSGEKRTHEASKRKSCRGVD